MPNKKHERKAKHQIPQKTPNTQQENTKYAKKTPNTQKKHQILKKTPTTPKKQQIRQPKHQIWQAKTKYAKIFIYAVLSQIFFIPNSRTLLVYFL